MGETEDSINRMIDAKLATLDLTIEDLVKTQNSLLERITALEQTAGYTDEEKATVKAFIELLKAKAGVV